jgi:hypothetical protein
MKEVEIIKVKIILLFIRHIWKQPSQRWTKTTSDPTPDEEARPPWDSTWAKYERLAWSFSFGISEAKRNCRVYGIRFTD